MGVFNFDFNFDFNYSYTNAMPNVIFINFYYN